MTNKGILFAYIMYFPPDSDGKQYEVMRVKEQALQMVMLEKRGLTHVMVGRNVNMVALFSPRCWKYLRHKC